MIYAALIFVNAVATLLAIVAVYTATRKRRARLPAAGSSQERVTVLKPLCGRDDALASNLETFFRQDYPNFELLFGVEGEEDPAIEVVRRLQKRFPDVPSRLVIHQGRRGLNPKVSNLRATLETCTNDLIVISDSNVAVCPDYLREMVGQMQVEGTGLVTNLFCGVGEQTLGARLENLHLNGPIVGSVAMSRLNGRTVSVGKSMMFRRSVFRRLGGMESVATLLAEDYVIGRMFRAAGYEVRLCAGVIRNVCVDATVKTFLRRHLRWGLLRSRLKPLMYPFEILANPMAVAMAAPFFGVPWLPALAWAVALTAVRDASQWICLRGPSGLDVIALGPFKEILSAGVWLVAPFLKHVSWRGQRYRVSAGTRLYAQAPPRLGCTRRVRSQVVGCPSE